MLTQLHLKLTIGQTLWVDLYILNLVKVIEFQIKESKFYKTYLYGANFLEYYYCIQLIFRDNSPRGGIIYGGKTLIVKGHGLNIGQNME